MLKLATTVLGISILHTFFAFYLSQPEVQVIASTPTPEITYSPIQIDYSEVQYYQKVSGPAQNQHETDLAKAKADQEAALAAQLAAQNAKLKVRKTTPPVVKKVVQKATPAPSYSSNEVVNLIYHYCSVYGLNADQCTRAIDIGYCESGLRANARSKTGRYGGVYQQDVNYFPGRAARVGISNGDVYNADHNVRVSIHMMATSGFHHWPNC